MDLEFLCEHLESNEAWLMERILHYAKRQDYTRYTPPLAEAWRASIQGLNESVRLATETFDAPPEFEPDKQYQDDPVSAFGVLEARRHRSRGVSLSMFLGLFKYFRQAYIDCLEQIPDDTPHRGHYRRYVRRVFDLVEISYCQEWASVEEGEQLDDLQSANRLATNEKSKYLSLFESLPHPVLLLASDLTVDNANHAAQLLLELPRGTQGEAYYGERPTLDRVPELKTVVASFASSDQDQEEAPLQLARDGGDRYYSVHLTRLLDVTDKLSGVVVHLLDVTADREARLALEASEGRYRTLFDDSSDAIMLLTREEGFLSCNPATLKLFGCTSEDHFISLFPGELSPAQQPDGQDSGALADARMSEALDMGMLQFEWRHHRLDGTPFNASVRLTAMEIQGRKMLQATVRDISERKALQVQLEESLAQLKRSNEDLEQFAYVASHDLREPLRMVSSFLDLLRKRYGGQLDERADRFIDHAVDGAERMERLLRDLLDLSRVGTHGRPMEPTDMDAALDRALKNLGKTLDETGAEVERGELGQVRGDGGQLEQLLQNLVGNGIKFRKPDARPRISITCQRRGDTAEFCVQDNGIGIEPEQAERIFEVFSRLHSQKAYPGSGIGLSICKKILQRHGGRIWVEPAPEGGSLFKFELTTS